MTESTKSGCPFSAVTGFLTPNADLPIRIALGTVFLFHGLQKFGLCGAEGDINGFAQFIGSLGFPFPLVNAYMAAIAEVLGGFLVLIGFQTRLGALLLVPPMVVAIFGVHLANGFSLEKHGYEYALTLLLSALTLAFMGPGCLSVDKMLKKKSGACATGCNDH